MTAWVQVFKSQVYGQIIESDIQLPGFQPYSHELFRTESTNCPPQTVKLTCEAIEHVEPSLRNYLIPQKAATGVGLYRINRQPNVLFGCSPRLGDYKLSSAAVQLNPVADLPFQHLLSFALGSGLGVQLYLRNIIPMHGMAFLNPDSTASLVFGVSGAGKSTLTAACIQAGIPVFSDDILPIQQIDGNIYIHPAHRRLKLNSALITELNNTMTTNKGSQLIVDSAYPGTDKTGWIAPTQSFAQKPTRITQLFFLKKIRQPHQGKLGNILSPFQTMHVLRRCVYRPRLIPFLGLNKTFFAQASLLSQLAPLRQLYLPHLNEYLSFQDYAEHIKALLQNDAW